jgi:hypothetical protein
MRRILSFICLVALAATASAQTAEWPTAATDLMPIAVMDLSGEKISKSDLTVLTDRLRAELFKTGQFRVMERERMAAILEEQGFQKSGCTSEDCAVEIGRLINVRKIVGGRIGRIGTVYSMSIRLIDVESGEIERTAVMDRDGSLTDVLTDVIRQVALELAGLAASGPEPTLKRGTGFGMLYIQSTPAGATIRLNGREREEKTPIMIERLPAGEHVIRLTSAHLIAQQRVKVIADDLVKLNLHLKPGRGSLLIKSRPPGAQVLIDGRNAGTSPLFIKDIAAGRHKLEMRKDGHMPWTENIFVNFGPRTNISAALKPCGWLTVKVRPYSATITLDGERAGTGSLYRTSLIPGKHTVALSLTDYDSIGEVVTVKQGHTADVDHTLTYRFGRVRITSTPSGARVSSHPGGIKGTTPLTADRVKPGIYDITVTKTDRTPWKKKVTVTKGRTTNVFAGLPLGTAARQRKQIKNGWRIAAIGAAVVATGIGLKYNSTASGKFSEASEKYDTYRSTSSFSAAASLHRQIEELDKDGESAVKKRNIFYGIAGVCAGVSITLTVF